jgi:hypothetical protein
MYLQGPEEGAADPIKESEGGNGWESIERWRVKEVESNDRHYTTLFPQLGGEARRGICMPLLLCFEADAVRGSISIEWDADGSDPTCDEDLQILCAAAWKIGRCAAAAGKSQERSDHLKSAESLFKYALEDVRQLAGQLPDSCALWLTSDHSSVPPATSNGEWTEEMHRNVSRVNASRAEFDAKRLAKWFAHRTAVDMRTAAPDEKPDARAFGRHAPADEDLLLNLSAFDARFCRDSRTFVLPIWSTTGKLASFAGVFKSATNPLCSENPEELRAFLRGSLAVLLKWSREYMNSSPYFAERPIILREAGSAALREWDISSALGPRRFSVFNFGNVA